MNDSILSFTVIQTKNIRSAGAQYLRLFLLTKNKIHGIYVIYSFVAMFSL